MILYNIFKCAFVLTVTCHIKSDVEFSTWGIIEMLTYFFYFFIFIFLYFRPFCILYFRLGMLNLFISLIIAWVVLTAITPTAIYILTYQMGLRNVGLIDVD